MKNTLFASGLALLAGFALFATGCVAQYSSSASVTSYSGTSLPAAGTVALVMEFRGGEPSPQERADVLALLTDYFAQQGVVLVEETYAADYLVHAVLEKRNPANPAEWTVVDTYSARNLNSDTSDEFRWPGGLVEDDYYPTTSFSYVGFGVFYPVFFDLWSDPWHRGRIVVCPPPRRHVDWDNDRWRDDRRWHRPERWVPDRHPEWKDHVRDGRNRPAGDNRSRDNVRHDDVRRPAPDHARPTVVAPSRPEPNRLPPSTVPPRREREDHRQDGGRPPQSGHSRRETAAEPPHAVGQPTQTAPQSFAPVPPAPDLRRHGSSTGHGPVLTHPTPPPPVPPAPVQVQPTDRRLVSPNPVRAPSQNRLPPAEREMQRRSHDNPPTPPTTVSPQVRRDPVPPPQVDRTRQEVRRVPDTNRVNPPDRNESHREQRADRRPPAPDKDKDKDDSDQNQNHRRP